MSKLHLDYQRSMKPLLCEGVLLLIVAMMVLVALGIYYRELTVQTDLWESRVSRIEQAMQRLVPGERPADSGTLDTALEVKSANEVSRQLSVPWNSLFETVESVGSKDVTLLMMEPDTEKRLVKISGEAKDMAAMLDYIKQLENRDVFGTVFLQSHHVQLQDAQKPVRFVLLANWREKP